MKVYIVHYKKLTERKSYLEARLKGFNIDYEFIDQFDRDNYDLGDYVYDGNNMTLWNERVDRVYNHEHVYRKLRESEICNTLSHLKAMEKTVEENLEYSIVLEDDCILNNDFSEKINYILDTVPLDYDIVFFGSSYSMEALDKITSSQSIKISENIFKKVHGISRTVDAYIIRNQACQLLLKEFKELILPFDFEMNYFLKKYNLNTYWYEPGFISQGSQTGKYSSSIR